MVFLFRRWRTSFGIEFKSGVKRKNVFKDKISLLVGELIRKKDWLRKRNIDRILSRKEF
jgi:hypothetical protein